MDKLLYVYLMEDQNALNKDVVRRHVEHLAGLDDAGVLRLCGPFADYRGGMVAFEAASKEAAEAVAQSDPFIAEGYKTYELRTLLVADRGNGYLL